MNRRQKIIVSITGIFIVLLALVGLTYAYFLTRIKGNENPKSISVTSAKLELVYAEENDKYIIGEGEIIEPNKTFETKTFTVTNNGNAVVDNYAVILEDVKTSYATTFVDEDGNEIAAGTTVAFKRPEDFELTIECSSLKKDATESTSCNGMDKGTLPLMDSTTTDETYITNGILVTNSIEVGEVQTFSVVLTYKEAGTDQSDDMNKKLEGKFNIIDTNNTVDITGTLTNHDGVDAIVTNSTRRESQINSDGSYKIVGLEAAVHTIKKKIGDTETEINKISIVKGKEAGVGEITHNGVTIPQITITDESRITTLDIDVKDNDVKVNFLNPYDFNTLPYNILNNGAQVLNTSTNKLSYDKTYTEKTEITKVSDGTDMSDTGIFTAPDDYGTSYYYRGPVKNNYVNFAGFTWRIVRINGDGSVRITLDGSLDKICVEKNTDDTCKTYAGPYSQYNESDRNNVYAGYMYGLAITDETTTNTKKNRCLKTDDSNVVTDYVTTYKTKTACESNGGKWTTNSYEATHANVKDSIIKTNVDKFYETYIENDNIHYEKYLADTLFCNDKTLSNKDDFTAGYTYTGAGLGFGRHATAYSAYERLFYKTPSLKCAENANNNYSRMTAGNIVGDNRFDMRTVIGNNVSVNNDLKYPIALLTVDEVVFAGLIKGTTNSSYYLSDSYNEGVSAFSWWTISPSDSANSTMRIFGTGYLGSFDADQGGGISPVINLRSDVTVTGNGTKTNPYVIG